MHVECEDWKNSWCGITVSIDPAEIDHLIELLQMLKASPDQHSHISSDYKGTGGVGDIEISIRGENQQHNMHLSSRALIPGEDLP